MPTTATYSEIRDMYPTARSISAAARDGWRIDKAADPVDGAAADISVELAEEVAGVDSSLLTFTR